MNIVKSLPRLIQGIALLGIADAGYLSANHFLGTEIKCLLVHGCDIVTNSVYSAIAGIPVAYLGLAYYLIMFGTITIAIENRSNQLIRLIALLSLAGFGFSLWFLYVQAFILEAFCTYCLISLGTSTAIFILAQIAQLKLPIFTGDNSERSGDNS